MEGVIRILLVEDNPMDVRLISETLKEAHAVQYELRIASSLAAVTNLIDSTVEIDVILADLSLPDSNGINTLHQIRAHAPTIPIVILTGYDDQDLAVLAVKEGAQDYIIKGDADGNQIARIIRYAIERNRLVVQLTNKAEDDFDKFFNLSVDLLCFIQSDSAKFLKINPAFTTLLGYSSKELVNRSILDFIHPEDLANTRKLLTENLKQGDTVINYENRCRCKNGSYKWLEWTSRPVPDQGITYAVARDVTRRKQADQALQESELLYRSVYKTAPLAFVGWDMDTRITDWNQHAEKIFGWQREEVIGKSFFDIIVPEIARAQVEVVVEKVLRGDIQGQGINQNLTRNGGLIMCEWNNAVLRNVNNELVGAISFGLDITQRVESENNIQQKIENLAGLVNVSSRFTATLELDTLFQATTDGAVELLGLDSSAIYLLEGEELYLWATTPALPPGFPDVYRKAPLKDHPHIGQTLSTGKPLLCPDVKEAVLTQAERQVSETRDLRTILYLPIVMGEEAKGALIVGSVGKCRDVSQSEIDVCITLAHQAALAITNGQFYSQLQEYTSELENRIAQRTAQLEAKTKDLEDFTYSVSHDLKAPLRGIAGYSNLLHRNYNGQLDEEGQFFLANIRQATQNMHQLISDLLAYSRLEQHEMVFRQVNLEEIINALLAEFAPQIETEGAQVDVQLTSVQLSADVEGLTQVFRNLIDNALKFSSKSPHPLVEIGGKKDEGAGYLCWVRDNGVGFDMCYHEKIFENFHRLNQNDEFPGTGIGLAIVAKAMERMNGRVWAESEPGKGAVFYLEFSSPATQKNIKNNISAIGAD
jgi:PAS domain S-box-containing protein